MSVSGRRLVGEPMGCQEFTELVTDYLEGALPEVPRLRFEYHLAICEHCPSYFRQIQETVRLARVLGEEPVPPETRARLLEAFRARRRGRGTG